MGILGRFPVSPLVLSTSLIVLSTICSASTVPFDGGGRPGNGGPRLADSGAAIQGTERLAWDQTAPSHDRLRHYGFTLYIDGMGFTLSGVECADIAGTDGFGCSAPLPQLSDGTHVLQLAAVVDAMESSRSSSLTVSVQDGRIVEGIEIEDDGPQPAASSLCAATTTACLAFRHEVTRPFPLSSPSAAPDGRLFFVEDGRHVRILVDGRLAHEPAFTVAGARSRIVALSVDPSFERTRFVLLAWTEETRRGRALIIARLRESNNRLGEPAVIVPDIALGSAGDPRVVQDDQGRIYVAIPADAERLRGRSDPYEGYILRFAANGLTWSEGLGSPIFARGYDDPRALTFDPRTYRLWLGGGHRGRGEGLTSIALGSTRGITPGQLAAAQPHAVIMPSSQVIIGLAPIATGAHVGPTVFIALDAAGSLLSARVEESGLTPQARVPFESGTPLSLGAGVNGEVFVVAASVDGAVRSFSIFRLEADLER